MNVRDSKMWAWLIGVVFVVGLTGAVAIPEVYSYMTVKRVERVRAEQRKAAVAIESLFVDDCGDSNPDAENTIPSKLTTPVAYLKQKPRDPFSPTGGPILYLNQRYRGNGTFYLLVSAGPDRDLDVQRLPGWVKVAPPMLLPDDTLAIRSDNTTGTTQFSLGAGGWWHQNLEAYQEASGKWITPDKRDIIYLPGAKDDWDKWGVQKDFEPFLAAHGVYDYDPTNGVVSDGDILRFSRQ